MNFKTVLGISAYYHDSAAALIVDGEIIAAAQEERFTRVKNTSDFPKNAIQFCLNFGKLEIGDLDAIVFYEKPFLKFERILENFYSFAPKGIGPFLKFMPEWSQKKIFLKREIRNELKELDPLIPKNQKIYFSAHHLSHAASAFYPSPYDNAAILTIDAVGEWATTSVGLGKGSQIEIIKEMHFPDSLGLLYSSFTYFLGFKVNSGEYKMMGLAPFGDLQTKETKTFIDLIRKELVSIYDDGSIKLNQHYFNYRSGLKMIHTARWETLFEMKLRTMNADFNQSHANLARAIQVVTEEVILQMARYAKKLTGSNNLCLAGGVALNSVANGTLRDLELL